MSSQARRIQAVVFPTPPPNPYSYPPIPGIIYLAIRYPYLKICFKSDFFENSNFPHTVTQHQQQSPSPKNAASVCVAVAGSWGQLRSTAPSSEVALSRGRSHREGQRTRLSPGQSVSPCSVVCPPSDCPHCPSLLFCLLVPCCRHNNGPCIKHSLHFFSCFILSFMCYFNYYEVIIIRLS